MRWIVPTGVAGIVALGASGVLSAQASPNLPPRTAAQLLVDVENAKVDGLSGTIVAKASLGLPSLPGIAANGNGSWLSLLSDSHTARVWYAGPSKQRFAVLDTLGESDVFRNGRDVWTYDSAKHEATHTVLPPDSEKRSEAATPTLTPEQAAEQALKSIDPTTVVTTDSARRVAGRAAYELVLAPRDQTSKVGSVRIAIDGKTKIPLGVQVYPRGGASPAVDVSFTHISYSVPDADNFTFTPPKSVHVKNVPLSQAEGEHAAYEPDFTTIGKGWTTIVELRSSDQLKGSNGEQQAVLNSLPRVSWPGGSGRLFDSKLLTAVITDDGRLFAGPVDKNVLVSAAEHHK